MASLVTGDLLGWVVHGWDRPRSRRAHAVAALALALLACTALPALARGAVVLNGVEGQRIGSPASARYLADWNDNSGYAVVYWGDGTSDTCQQGSNAPANAPSGCYWQLSNSEFSGYVFGWHTYAEQASFYNVSVTEYDAQGVQQIIYLDSATITDAPLTPSGVTLNALVGTNVSIPVGHFVDQDPNSGPADFTATVDWGDGSPPDSTAKVQRCGWRRRLHRDGHPRLRHYLRRQAAIP